MFKIIAFLLTLTSTIAFAGEPSPKDVVAQLYKAHASKHDPFNETQLLSRYLDTELVKLYLRDLREAKGEVGRLEVDPLYYAQDTEIKDFSISEPKTSGKETIVTARFKNIGKSTRVEYIMNRTANSWRVSDIRYEDGNSLKKILQGPL